MQFDEIRKGIGHVAFDNLRADNDNYFEAVVANGELGELTGCLEKLFGSPAWPSGKPLLSEAQKIIKDFGGIREGQTFYFRNEGRDSAFAMLWPWQDMKHTTVKIAIKKS
ncbi:MAG: hypothetical protein ABIH75_00350 [Candidatus Omnitrophota bacterium]